MKLDPHSPVPLWAQLVAVLRQRLGGGEYAERFPTEMELTAEFEVSRATVREAVRRLKDEGLLDARRGSGTFVVRRRLEQSFIGTPGLSRAIVAAGMEEESTVLHLDTVKVNDDGDPAAVALGLRAGDVVVRLERLRGADSRPVALDRSVLSLPEEARESFLAAELGPGSVYDVLAGRCGIQVTGATEHVRAVTCTAEERQMLGLATSEGVLEVERTAYAGNKAIEWRRSLLRGSAYVLSASWGVVPAR